MSRGSLRSIGHAGPDYVFVDATVAPLLSTGTERPSRKEVPVWVRPKVKVTKTGFRPGHKLDFVTFTFGLTPYTP